ncbi:MAG TPA: hypothetical protein VLL48_06950, partial [Longimicrobiales bacterium]|nr:hypothetical protein [Longimicrobiales bacterium]
MTSEADVRISTSPPEGWDDLVTRDPRGSFCHLAGWGRVFREVLGLEPLFLHVGPEGSPEGIMPLYRMGRLPLGTTLVSVPYLNYGGPLGSPQARRSLARAAVTETERSGDRRLEIRTRSDLDAGLPPGR